MTIKITGLDKALAELKKIDSPKRRQRGTLAVAFEIQKDIEKYPPESEANRPPAPFYIRGTGTVSTSGRIHKTSEDLNKRWTVKSEGRTAARIRNTASYGIFVYGDGDGKRQTRFHKRRGWPLIYKYLKVNRSKLERTFVRFYLEDE